MKAKEALGIVEDAYDVDASSTEWLRQLAIDFGKTRKRTQIVIATRMSLQKDGRPVFHEAFSPSFENAVEVLTEHHATWDLRLARALFRVGTYAGTVAEHINDVLASEDDALTKQVVGDSPFATAYNTLAVGSFDARRHGVVLTCVDTDAIELTDAERNAQQQVGVHLLASLRLRSALDGRDPIEQAEAVLEPDGRLVHAAGAAEPLRDTLRQRVKHVDKARAAGGETADALAVWQGLVEGRWSLLDRFDTDGRRYYVAVANPAVGVPLRALTDVEAQIVAMAVAGEPNKLIGYALGMAESSVAAALGTAMRKIGARDRVELIRIGRTLLDSEPSGA